MCSFVRWGSLLYILSSTVLSNILIPINHPMCSKLEDLLDECVAYGYDPKWIPCAKRIFEVDFLQGRNAFQLFLELELKYPGQRLVDFGDMVDEDGFYIFMRGELLDHEIKICRTFERKILKNCDDITKYTCVELDASLKQRRRQREFIRTDFMFPALDDPEVLAAMEECVGELQRRVTSKIGDGGTVVVGELLDTMRVVAAGFHYTITVLIGVTEDEICHKKATNGLVNAENCRSVELSKVSLSVLHQTWSDPSWLYFEMEDLEGPPLKETFWD